MAAKKPAYIKDNNTEKKLCLSLEKKLSIFKKYLSITKKVILAIKDHNKANKLTELVSQRQVCINKIDKINLSINSRAKDYDKFIIGFNEITFLSGYYLNQIKNIIKTIGSMDRELMVIAEQESEKIKTDLLKIHNNRQAAQGYAYGSARGYKTGKKYPPKFLDIKN